MNIEEFLTNPAPLPAPSIPFLTEYDALWDSILIDFRLNLFLNRGYLLIQGMGMPPEYNTGVVVLHGLTSAEVADPDGAPRAIRTIHLWKPAFRHGRWSVETSTEFGGSLSASALGAEIVLGLTEVGELALPDFESATDLELTAGLVSWRSEFRPLARQVVGAVPSFE